MTAHRRLIGRNFWYSKPKSKGRDKLKVRWETGIFLGIRNSSNEVLIGTSEGVIKVRSIRRKGTNG